MFDRIKLFNGRSVHTAREIDWNTELGWSRTIRICKTHGATYFQSGVHTGQKCKKMKCDVEI